MTRQPMAPEPSLELRTQPPEPPVVGRSKCLLFPGLQDSPPLEGVRGFKLMEDPTECGLPLHRSRTRTIG